MAVYLESEYFSMDFLSTDTTLEALLSEPGVESGYLDMSSAEAKDCSGMLILSSNAGGFSPSTSEPSEYAESGIASPFDANELFREALGESYSLPLFPATSSVSLTSQPQFNSREVSPCLSSSQLGHALPSSTSPSLPPLDKQCERNRKNAEAAKQNRQKKKLYVSSLEKEAVSLRTEVSNLKQRCSNLESSNTRLETEVAYLKSVLVNQSKLSSLLAKIPISEGGVHLTSSFSLGKKADPCEEECSRRRAKRARLDDQTAAGVCLHVSNDRVSLEFCAECSLRS